jgi:hypothetical protein
MSDRRVPNVPVNPNSTIRLTNPFGIVPAPIQAIATTQAIDNAGTNNNVVPIQAIQAVVNVPPINANIVTNNQPPTDPENLNQGM